MMNFYYNTYAEIGQYGNTEVAIVDYGIEQMLKLFKFLGYQSDFDINTSLKKAVRCVKAPKNYLLLGYGEKLNKVHFIVSGAVACVDEKGGINFLLTNGNLIMDYSTFLKVKPSKYTIRTTCNSIILTISKPKWLNIVLKDKNEISNSLIINSFFLKNEFHQRLIYILRQNSKNKVKLLKKEFPDILENFTNQEIASFLGMQAETFSRVKSI